MRVAICVVVVGLAGCGEQAQFQMKCDKITQARCNRDSDCSGIQVDYATCSNSFESTWICDPDATLEMMDECVRQMDSKVTPCDSATLMPTACYEVLCSAAIGCEFGTTPGSQTGVGGEDY